MKRILVTGAGGFIGWYLLQRLRAVQGYEVMGVSRSDNSGDDTCRWFQADLTNPNQLEGVFRSARPQVVVHLAAMSNVAEAGRSPRQATEINVDATGRIATLCSQYGSKLVFLSTDYVFSGDQGYYREDAPPAPVGHYGNTKWQGEQAVAAGLSRWSVLRVGLAYGWRPQGSHENLATLVIDRLERQMPFSGYTDMYRTPVYVGDVVESIVKLSQEDYPGVHHIAGPEWMNMGEFALTVAQVFNLDPGLVELVTSPAEDSEGARPKLLGLDADQTARRLGVHRSNLASGLQRMKMKWREHP